MRENRANYYIIIRNNNWWLKNGEEWAIAIVRMNFIAFAAKKWTYRSIAFMVKTNKQMRKKTTGFIISITYIIYRNVCEYLKSGMFHEFTDMVRHSHEMSWTKYESVERIHFSSDCILSKAFDMLACALIDKISTIYMYGIGW